MKREFPVIILICVLAAIFPFKVFSQNKQNINLDELEKTALSELREKNGVGAAVAVIMDDKVILAKGFGAANVETNTPVTPETLFQIGSVTKTFTTTLILLMAEDGKLKLDAPVGDYAKNINPRLAKVTLGQLLSHTSGIIDEPDEYGAQDESLMATYIRSWKDDYSLFDPGEVFSYSNSGFALAGFAAQEASAEGKLYAEIMNKHLFEPFGMKSTTFCPTVAMTFPLAVGHIAKLGEKPFVVRPLPQDARLYPAGTMYSNLNDLARFAVAFLNNGKIEGKQIISHSVIEQMSKPRARQLSATDDTSYGYGLFMNTNRGVRRVWHDGSMTGYTASLLFVPEQRFAVIILSNTNNVVLNKTQEKAMELSLTLKQKEDLKSKILPAPTETAIKQYVGTYTQPNRFKIEIFTREGKLFIKEFNQEMLLTKIGENRFSFQFPQAMQPLEIYIQPEKDGKPSFVHQYVWAFKKIK
jgi:CubicO group peptidase (beta-lactamase class C family)